MGPAARWTPSPPVSARVDIARRIGVATAVVNQHGRFLARPLISRSASVLRQSCIDGGRHEIERAVGDLIGLGPGLTPAGDDYLAGYLAALLHIAADNPHATVARTLVSDAINAVGPGSTHPMSAFLLDEYRAGMIPDFLSMCLRALRRASTEEHLRTCVLRVLDHGASSGTEMMLGILAASKDFGPEPRR
jgi:hypothetical protein